MRRRDFLKTSALAAGISLLEGCRRQEEEWIVQVPRRPGVLQGESVWRASVCGQCAAGCGVLVRVVDGDAKKIEGIPGHPVNRGGVCALGHSALQELYNPDRVLTPQRRMGARGEGRFEALGWEDGLSAAVEAIAGTPPERIAFVGGDASGATGALLRRLAAELGAAPPAFVEPPELDVERRAARIALGTADVPYFDLARSDYVLSIGAPFADRWRSPVHYTRALAEMRRGRAGRRGRLVHAEARMSLTAANADAWLPVRPGTEGLLARAIAGVLLEEGLADDAGRRGYLRLFPDAAPDVESAAARCGVPADRIVQVAHELAGAERRVVVAGGSAALHTNGLHNTVAALGLNVLLGTLGREGGVFAPVRYDLAAGLEPEGRDGGAADRTSVHELAARLRGESGPPVELLLAAEADPVHALPASLGLADALAGVASVVTLSSFSDDTTRHADVVLPLRTELERFDAVQPSASVGVRALGLAGPAVEPLGEGHHPADVLLAIATALGEPVAGAFPWSSYESYVRAWVEGSVARLPGGAGADAATYYFEAVARGGIFEEGPPTAVPPGPTGAAPAAARRRLAGDRTDFPFVLVPFESLKVDRGRGANRPWLQEMPDPMTTVMWNGWLELSPDDAHRLGVRDGDRLRIESGAGALEAHAVLDPALRPGVVAMPLGQGHADYGRYAAGRGANPLGIVAAERVDGTDASALAATRVRITRLGPGDMARYGRSHTDGGEGEMIPVGWAPMEEGTPGGGRALPTLPGPGRGGAT